MKLIFFVLFILFSHSVFANEEDNTKLEVINLYETKSLDQMVLENLNDKEEIDEKIESSNESTVTPSNEVEVKQIEIIKNDFFFDNDISDLENYFANIQDIPSKTLQIHINEILEDLELNLEIEKDKQIFFLIINYFKSIGLINKSYELIDKYDLSNDINLSFYTKVKLNYLLSTFQLNEACNLKEELNLNVRLDFFFLEKLDILCMII